MIAAVANKFVEQHHADADISCRVNARQAVARLVVVSWGHFRNLRPQVRLERLDKDIPLGDKKRQTI